jgi:hypothetical protein
VRANPPRDAIQNAEFVAASRDGSTGLVTFEFRRLLTTNDTSFDRVSNNSKSNFLRLWEKISAPIASK